MLEKEVDDKYYLSDTQLNHMQNTKYESMGVDRVKDINEETINTITTMTVGNREPKIKGIIFKSKDKRLPEMLDKIDFSSDEPQSLDLYNRTVSNISQTLTMPNHNAQAIAVKEPKINVFANIQANGRENGNIYNSDGLSPTLLARDYKDPKKITELSIAIPKDTNLGYALAHEGDGLYTNRPEQKRGVVQKQMIQTIKANSNDLGVVVKEETTFVENKYQGFYNKNGYVPELFNPYNEVEITNIAPTMTTQSGSMTSSSSVLINNQLRIRKLTPRECYRLMGFGDKAFDLAQPNQSNSSLYHQAGDSIVVNVLMGLFGGLL
jgi:DNA (cytosine-5)-methyltransferase 1